MQPCSEAGGQPPISDVQSMKKPPNTLHTRVWAVSVEPRPHWRRCCRCSGASPACSYPANSSSSSVAGQECDRCPERIDVQKPWIIRALERPEPTTVEERLSLAAERDRASVEAWR